MAPRLFILGKHRGLIEIIQRWSSGKAKGFAGSRARDKIRRIAYAGSRARFFRWRLRNKSMFHWDVDKRQWITCFPLQKSRRCQNRASLGRETYISGLISFMALKGKPEQLSHLLANQRLPNYKFAYIKRCKCRLSFVLVTDLNSVL